MVLAVERVARARTSSSPRSAGIEALPGAVNVIPSCASFTLDMRSPTTPSAPTRRAAEEAVRANRRPAPRRVWTCNDATTSRPPPAHPALIEQLAAAVERAGIRPLRLPSGAGHDGLAMVALCPIAMLFVRCKGGISHNPAESITAEDADVAVASSSTSCATSASSLRAS